MPVFKFTLGPPTAGCLASVVVQTPWAAEKNYEQPSQQFPQGRWLTPPEAAYAFLCNYANQRDGNGTCFMYFPPEPRQIQCQAVSAHNGGPGIAEPTVYPATVDRQQVNAPYNMPIGNGRGLTLPPEQTPKNAPRGVPCGMYEQLEDVALANTSDPLMGEMDAEGGTWTDFSPTDRTETKREIAMPYPKKAHER